MSNKFYITTPIYYVNDKPHIGHAYTSIAADVLARYHRLKGEDVFYLTGTDEHGAKVAQAAEKAGISPQEFCDINSAKFKLAWRTLNISNDDFIRTTEERHEKIVKILLEKLKDAKTPKGNSAIYEGEYKGLYCVGCEKYITEKDLTKDGLCPDHLKKPELLKEKNWFFRLSDYQDILAQKIKKNEIKILPAERENEIKGFLAQGLEDVAVSRPSVKWGIPVPWDSEQTVYVWIEALMNYLSVVDYDKAKFKKYWPANAHFMAKDIIKFHAVIWPALLLALDLELPKVISSHGFFTTGGQKMSKSLGNVLDPVELANKYGVDALRYFIMREIPYGYDGDISEERLKERYQSDLANGIGNLTARVVAMAEKENGKTAVDSDDKHFKKIAADIWSSYATDIEELKIDKALEATWGFIAECDKYIDENKPWELSKKGEVAKLHKILYNLLESLRHIAWLVKPFMPETSDKILAQIGSPDKVKSEYDDKTREWGGLSVTINVKKEESLFPRLYSTEAKAGL